MHRTYFDNYSTKSQVFQVVISTVSACSPDDNRVNGLLTKTTTIWYFENKNNLFSYYVNDTFQVQKLFPLTMCKMCTLVLTGLKLSHFCCV